MSSPSDAPSNNRRPFPAIAGGGLIGILGGLIGLGGAEFRLPLLIGLFGFPALEAVIVNKAMSLVVVASALPFRAASVSFSTILDHWLIIANLLGGSIFGAWFGAGWATRLRSETLYKIISVLLVLIACVLLLGHEPTPGAESLLSGFPQIVAGIVAGFCIGVVAALMGVAGGELLIPTLLLLFGVDIKLAGSLSLAISLPTMLIGRNLTFALLMAAGSIAGSFIGGCLLGLVPNSILLPLLAAILLISAVKIWRHK